MNYEEIRSAFAKTVSRVYSPYEVRRGAFDSGAGAAGDFQADRCFCEFAKRHHRALVAGARGIPHFLGRSQTTACLSAPPFLFWSAIAMDVNLIYKQIHREPFKPFPITMNNGREFYIRHPINLGGRFSHLPD